MNVFDTAPADCDFDDPWIVVSRVPLSTLGYPALLALQGYVDDQVFGPAVSAWLGRAVVQERRRRASADKEPALLSLDVRTVDSHNLAAALLAVNALSHQTQSVELGRLWDSLDALLVAEAYKRLRAVETDL